MLCRGFLQFVNLRQGSATVSAPSMETGQEGMVGGAAGRRLAQRFDGVRGDEAAGSLMVNVVPAPGWLLAVMVPSMLLIMP